MIRLAFHCRGGEGLVPLLAAAILALAMALLFYRFERIRYRPGLVALRAAVLWLVILALAGGRFDLSRRILAPPRVAVLVDRSGSMGTQEGGMSRMARVRSFFRDDAFRRFTADHDWTAWAFADSLILDFAMDSLPTPQGGTDLARALEGLARRHPPGTLDGVLLLSDGRISRGSDPVKAAFKLGCPLFAVALGDTQAAPDLYLARVSAPDETFLGEPVPVRLAVGGQGMSGEPVRVAIHDGRDVLADTTLMMPAQGFHREATVPVRPRQVGGLRWRVTASPLSGDATVQSDTQQVLIRVRQGRIRLLLVAGSPGADVAAFRRAVEADGRFHLLTRIQKNSRAFYQGALPSAAVLDSLDALVLWDYPGPHAPGWQRLRALIAKRKVPWMAVAASRLDPSSLSALDANWPRLRTEAPLIQSPLITPLGLSHGLMGLDPDAATQGGLPPLASRYTAPSEGALLSLADRPVVLAAATPRRVLLMGHGFFRWSLASERPSPLDGTIWPRLMAWLTEPQAGTGRLSADRLRVESGQILRFTANLDDETGQPRQDARPLLALTGPGGVVHRAMVPTGSGRFTLALTAGTPGAYRAALLQGAASSTVDSLQLWVAPFEAEQADRRADPALLRRMAEATGGAFYSSDSLGSGLREWSLPGRQVEWTGKCQIGSTPMTLFLLLVLLGLEWLIRRRNGLL